MSGCNTDDCQKVKRFIESQVTEMAGISVFEEANSNDIFVRKAGKTLTLTDPVPARWLDDTMKQKIREFLSV